VAAAGSAPGEKEALKRPAPLASIRAQRPSPSGQENSGGGTKPSFVPNGAELRARLATTRGGGGGGGAFLEAGQREVFRGLVRRKENTA
jgi:hypothetical protein